ncbi:MAG: hypothetical protein K0U59_11850 [Gammaproteobacteria bacterium]|nr:hypothetical protein [Gammaproteobacteria bacterium]
MKRSLYLFTVLLLITLPGCDRQSQTKGVDTTETVSQTDSDIPSICTPEWFNWVNQQLPIQSDDTLNTLYPNGLPEVGSGEWFEATDVLTAGNGERGVGPRPGSDAWCFMIQQRLNNPE